MFKRTSLCLAAELPADVMSCGVVRSTVSNTASDDSYIQTYVQQANNQKVHYTNKSLKLYAAIPWEYVFLTLFFGSLGTCLMLQIAPIFVEPVAVSVVACLAYIAYQVRKSAPYIVFDSFGVTVDSCTVAWNQIKRYGPERTEGRYHYSHKVGNSYIGSSVPVVSSKLVFYDTYNSPVATIVNNGWLPIPFNNLVALAGWYCEQYIV